jgi:hypothetical protein
MSPQKGGSQSLTGATPRGLIILSKFCKVLDEFIDVCRLPLELLILNTYFLKMDSLRLKFTNLELILFNPYPMEELTFR